MLIRGICRDPVRRSLVTVAFAGDIDAVVVAEGVELPAELAVVRDLGAGSAQGYLPGAPAVLEAASPGGGPGPPCG